MPKISVIIPIYNVEKYLRECLDSVVNQTLSDIEIICINDDSPDNSLQIVKEYAAKDNRIQVITKPNGGYGSACNMGLAQASGDYIAILESDDFIAPEMYEKLYNLAVEYDADIVKSPFYENIDTVCRKEIKPVKWYENNKLFNMPNKVFTIYEHPEFLYFHPSIWSCVYKREFLKNHNLRFIEAKSAGWTDNPFQVQTMCLAKKIFYTDERFYYWRRTGLMESDELKDYTIPFKRSDEIHEWLDENKITDKNLLACLYKREFAYIHIMFGMLSLNKLTDGLKLISKMLKRMNIIIIKNNKLITKKERNDYMLFKSNPFSLYFLISFKNFRKRFISIRCNRHEKTIIFLGRKFLEV